MKLNAYVLACDPTWIEASVRSYYAIVDEIVVSYDSAHRGWTGAPVAVAECLRRLEVIDTDGKMRYEPGEYYRPEHSPMENDTYQRQCAMEFAGRTADWVLELDTDEVLPDTSSLLAVLRVADEMGVPAVEWPMRVLYSRVGERRYLEVCAADGADRFEYPGPIACRPSVTKCDARRARELFLRVAVQGDIRSLQLRQELQPNEHRLEMLSGEQAILHNSWGRSPASVRSKIASWGHNMGLKSWLYYYMRWRPAPYVWRWMRDFHPFAHGLWPALKPCVHIPESLFQEAA